MLFLFAYIKALRLQQGFPAIMMNGTEYISKGGCRMRIGYASQTVGIPSIKYKTTRLNNVTEEKLLELIRHNLKTLDRIMDYNIKNRIPMFRISSDIIPFGSHSINTLKWWEIFEAELSNIGEKAMKHNIRLSMHPGQYTVLNSPNPEVVEKAVADLWYHARFLDALGMDGSHKIILHIGGVYGDKKAASQRFVQNYKRLDPRIQKRLVIENDDRQYTISDVLAISEEAQIPVVFDNLHHACNPDHTLGEMEWLMAARKTWMEADGLQKIHYSQQDPDKRLGAHSHTIDLALFDQFYQELPTKQLDIMFEVKDKNLSAIKGLNYLHLSKIKFLEQEWGRYKYWVLEHSPQKYNEIRQLLKDKSSYPVLAFYELIDEALATPLNAGHAVNAVQHIWGYVNQLATPKERARYEKYLQKMSDGESVRPLKRLLWKLTQQKEDRYLLDSLYFSEIY